MFILSNLHCATFALCEILLLLLPAIIWVKCGRHDIQSSVLLCVYNIICDSPFVGVCAKGSAQSRHTHTHREKAKEDGPVTPGLLALSAYLLLLLLLLVCVCESISF
jgi:hypothetical protein